MPFCKSQCNSECPDRFGCVKGICEDFKIRQHDTKPPLILSISDCDGFIDTTDSVAEVSIFAKAKFKKNVLSTDTYFALANDVGFEQSLIGDIILTSRARNPEQMLITGYDEENRLIQVSRGYNGTTPANYKKNTCIKIFRTLNSIADLKMIYEDIEQIDGTTINELTDSQIIYNWQPNDTCLQGCYWLEIKLLKMSTDEAMNLSINDSIIPTFTSAVMDCTIGVGVESVRRFPVDKEAFLVKIIESSTAENLI